eukprot:COSAG02_NODE_13704_length_1359_cov_1.403968_1_plen_95_part_00
MAFVTQYRRYAHFLASTVGIALEFAVHFEKRIGVLTSRLSRIPPRRIRAGARASTEQRPLPACLRGAARAGGGCLLRGGALGYDYVILGSVISM